LKSQDRERHEDCQCQRHLVNINKACGPVEVVDGPLNPDLFSTKSWHIYQSLVGHVPCVE